ncbi:MAG: hypothetical protein AAGD01_15140 [Acidobacteriota bacterium]
MLELTRFIPVRVIIVVEFAVAVSEFVVVVMEFFVSMTKFLGACADPSFDLLEAVQIRHCVSPLGE